MPKVIKRCVIGLLLIIILISILFLDYRLETSRIFGNYSSGWGITLLVLFFANFTAYEIVKIIRKTSIHLNLTAILLGVNAMIIGSVVVSQNMNKTFDPIWCTNNHFPGCVQSDRETPLEFNYKILNKEKLIEFKDVQSITHEEYIKYMNNAKKRTMRDAVIIPIPKYLMLILGFGLIFTFFCWITALWRNLKTDDQHNQRILSIVMSMLVFGLVGFSYSCAIFIRIIPFYGLYLIIFTLTVARLGDSGAYFIGRAFGRNKLIPAISPKKTIEGSIGGFATSVILGAFLAYFFDLGLICDANPWISGAIFGLIIGFAAQLSDLFSSLLKRWAKVKDSSNLIPEFGGILDLSDNFLMALPTMYVILLIIWV
ncbi:MAG: phosphatidate cytidylyltransferase [Planctomycetes bacterium]|nr:phosphatidate cytidylyltransferase [Planctomycetota bacterium]